MNRSLQGLQKKLDGFASGAKALAGVFLTYQLGHFIGEQFKFAASLGETAQQLGITTKQLQVYSAIGGQVGIGQEDMERGLAKLTVSLGKAALGAQEPQKAFAALGISVRDTAGHVKTAGDVLPEIANKLAKVTSPAQRAAAEVALFGKAGQRLDNILSGGQQGIDDYAKGLEETGQILDDKIINQADTAADRIEALNRQLKVSVAKIVAENANSILALANALATVTSRALQFIANYPRLTAALAGAAIGARLAGPIGAGVGFLAGGAATTYYQQNSSMDLGTRTAELNKATTAVRGMLARGATGTTNRGGLQQQLNELNRQRGLFEQARKANAAPALPALPPLPDGEDLPDFLKSGGGGGGKGRTPKGPKDRTDENLRQYQDQLARLSDDLLDATKDNVIDAGQLADIARKRVTVETDKLTADLDEMAAKNPIIAAHKDELVLLVQQAMAQKQLTISTEQLERSSQELLDVRQAANDNERDLLSAQEGLVLSNRERATLQLRLLELDKTKERLSLEEIVASKTATDAQKQIAQQRLGMIDRIYGARAEGVQRQNEGPLQSYLRQISLSGDQMNEALEQVAANGLQSFSDGLADAIVNFKSLGNVAKQVLAQMLADFLRLQINKGLSSLFGGLFGGVTGGGGGVGSLVHEAGHAAGGLITGPGSGTSDSVLARVSNGEFILNAAAVSRIGVANLARINDHPRFAMGGIVGRMPALNDNRGGITINIDAKDAVLAQTVRGWVAEGIEVATQGGAALADAKGAKRAKWGLAR